MARKPCGVISSFVQPIRRRAVRMVFSLIGRSPVGRLGRTHRPCPVIGYTSRKTFTARMASGTRCGRPLSFPCTVRFILAAGSGVAARDVSERHGEQRRLEPQGFALVPLFVPLLPQRWPGIAWDKSGLNHLLFPPSARHRQTFPDILGRQSGQPGGTRTPDIRLRRSVLYPVELRAVCRGQVPRAGVRWSGRRDSNSRPTGPKPVALPGCATPRTSLHCTQSPRSRGLGRREHQLA